MKYIFRLFLIILTAISISGCGATKSKKDMKAVTVLCANFSRSYHAALLTPSAKKDLDAVANGGGIPEDIRQAYNEYYAGEALDAAKDFNDVRRGKLDYKQNMVLKACHAESWSENPN